MGIREENLYKAMVNKIRKFEEYTQDPLMNDLKNVEDDGIVFNPKEWEIDSVIDVLVEDPTKSEDNRLKEFATEAITFDTSIPKDISRGDHIWITALIKKKGSTSFNDAGKMCVLKLRVVDLYYGLSHLNKVINK